MYKIISLFLFFVVQIVHSEETTMVITSDIYEGSKLSNSTPQVFLFESNGKLIHRKIGWERGLKQVFNNTTSIENAKMTKNQLLSLFDETPTFSDYDFTLVFITDFDEENACPPCTTQNKINKAVIKSLKDKKIHLVTIRLKFLGDRTIRIL
jgi:hypothetical protein